MHIAVTIADIATIIVFMVVCMRRKRCGRLLQHNRTAGRAVRPLRFSLLCTGRRYPIINHNRMSKRRYNLLGYRNLTAFRAMHTSRKSVLGTGSINEAINYKCVFFRFGNNAFFFF